MSARVTKLYRYGTRLVVPTIFCGTAVAGIASVMKNRHAVNAGLAVLVSGFVVWGFSCGTAALWAAIATVRETGIRPFVKDCLRTPVVAAVGIMEMMLYLTFVFGGVWLILKITGIAK